LYRLCTGALESGAKGAPSTVARQARSSWIASENARLSRHVARDVRDGGLIGRGLGSRTIASETPGSALRRRSLRAAEARDE
jgi:hypothetical protein